MATTEFAVRIWNERMGHVELKRFACEEDATQWVQMMSESTRPFAEILEVPTMTAAEIGKQMADLGSAGDGWSNVR
jgi:hypothetical protein